LEEMINSRRSVIIMVYPKIRREVGAKENWAKETARGERAVSAARY